MKAFALGLQFCLTTFGCEGPLDDVPEFAVHVSRLRAACAGRIAWGRFRHTRGIEVTSDAGIVAYGYESADGLAVIITAPGEGGTARVVLDREAFRVPGGGDGQLWSLDGTVQPVNQTGTLTMRLETHGAAVWMPQLDSLFPFGFRREVLSMALACTDILIGQDSSICSSRPGSPSIALS